MERENIQKSECRATNLKAAQTNNCYEKLAILVNHNNKGITEGWLDEIPNFPLNRISCCPFENAAKLSTSEFCYFDTEIQLHMPSLTAEDIPFLKWLLTQPEYFLREYEKVKIWDKINTMIPIPEKTIFLEEVKLSPDSMPPLGLLGNIINAFNGNEPRHFDSLSESRYFKFMEMPEEFSNLLFFIRKGFDEGVISKGHTYKTVRYGECRSGAQDRFEFNLSLNGRLYHVKLYGSDRGGSPYSPCHYGKDLTITRVEEGISDYTCNIGLNNDVVFRNLARLLRANYPFSNSGVPLAGII